MIKRHVQYLLIALSFICVISCSSCFEFIEEINLNNDGSGIMQLTLNLSQSKSKVASVLLLDSVNHYKVPDKQEIQNKMNEAVGYLRKQNGISNVKSNIDFSNYIATITFSFRELGQINNITKNLLAQQNISGNNLSAYGFNRLTNMFFRSYKYLSETKKQYDKLKNEDKEIFKSASYTSIYRFQRTIATQTNPGAQISKSQKAVMQKCSVMDLINGTAMLNNVIQLNP